MKKGESKIKTLIIVPAYNEEESIKKVVEEIKSVNKDVDVIVVNDGSKDNTLKEVLKTDAIAIDLPCNLGIGGAVQTGYLYAYKNDYDVAIQIDGDGQHNPKYIKDMVKIIESGKADMVIGSRFIEKTSYKQTFLRMFGINILSFIIKMFTGVKIYDATSGYRAVNRDIIKRFAMSYPCDYPEPDTNLQMLLAKKKIIEMPMEMRLRTTGKSFASPLKSIQYMVKVSLALFISRIRKV